MLMRQIAVCVSSVLMLLDPKDCRVGGIADLLMSYVLVQDSNVARHLHLTWVQQLGSHRGLYSRMWAASMRFSV